MGDQRDEWQIDYAVKVVPGQNAFENAGGISLLAVKESRVMFSQCSRNSLGFPWRVFPAVFLRKKCAGSRYRTNDKTGRGITYVPSGGAVIV